MDTVASSVHWAPSLSCPSHFSILSAGFLFVTRTDTNFGDPHPVSANSDIPLGCGNAVMLLLSTVKSAATGLWCSRSRLRVLLWSAGIAVEGYVQRGRFQGVS